MAGLPAAMQAQERERFLDASDACFNFNWSLVLIYSVFPSSVDFFILSMIVSPLCLLVFFTSVDRVS